MRSDVRVTVIDQVPHLIVADVERDFESTIDEIVNRRD